MTANIISVANMKGGVGKTTIAVALAQQFAKGVRTADDAPVKSARVLVVDLDAQANASFWLCGDRALTERIEQGKTIDAFLEDVVVFEKERALADLVFTPPAREGAAPVSVIPASPELRIVERELINFLSRRTRSLREVERVVAEIFRRELAALRESFDVILFDSAPGISALTEAALRASDIVIVPTVPDFISNLGLEAFCKSIWWANINDEAQQKTPWVVANMVKESAHHRAMLDAMRAEANAEDGGFRMFAIEIPDMLWIEEAAASVNGESAHAFAADALGLYSRLAAEVVEVTNGEAH
ncbi:MAG: AAA family ATPase [Alphaproteobacteria bacterium]|nr:AAA family ATPase [Alphaproteobacteria bacterium]